MKSDTRIHVWGNYQVIKLQEPGTVILRDITTREEFSHKISDPYPSPKESNDG